MDEFDELIAEYMLIHGLSSVVMADEDSAEIIIEVGTKDAA